MFGSLAFQLIVFVLLFAFCTYACILADPETSDIGRLCTKTIPSALFERLEGVIGQNGTSQLTKLMEYGFQLTYLVVVLGSWSIVFAYGYPEIEKSTYVSTYHQLAGYAVFAMCMGSWHYACNVGPGNVTTRTIPLFDHYEYDDVLYTNRLCSTLKIRKIARSKYDRFSNKHVPRFDHFCGWLNQAVGERNYRWFLLFLAVHVGMCCYGTFVMASLMYGEVLEKNLLHATFFNAVTGAEVEADYIIIFHYLFARHIQICGVLMLMSVMALVLAIFLGFHLYITSFNMTTNEYFKWRSVKRWHKKEKKKYQQALKDGKIGTRSITGGVPSKQVPDGDVGCTGPVADGLSSDIKSDDDIIDPGPMPENIYNKGIIANFLEVFFPLSSDDKAIQRYRAALRDSPDTAGNNQNENTLKSKAI